MTEKTKKTSKKTNLVNVSEYIIVRHQTSGVWSGIEVACDRPGFIRLQGRRLWQWQGALDCSTLALFGPTGGKVSGDVTVDLPVAGIIEIIAQTATSVAAVAALPSAR